ncbi:MAG: sugar phosphate isomerase/epimerase [Oscillospiraceae bacterium]|nr:sugar phosphate isomerase/epimerase [Oscillospiraceae bacterium]
MKHYKAVQMYTVRDYLRDFFKESLAKISAMGYDAIQGGYRHGMEVEEYVDILNGYGLKELHAGGRLDGDLSPIFKQAKAFGVTEVGIGSIPDELQASYEGFKKYAAQLNEIGKRLFEGGGLSVNYHNHALEFASFGGTNGMDILFEETDPKYVHFTLDTHWVTCGGQSPSKWIRRAEGRMPYVHFKDYAINAGKAEYLEGVSKRFAEVGQGNIDWEDVVSACRDINISAYIVEQDFCQGSPFDSLKISFDKLVALGL